MPEIVFVSCGQRHLREIELGSRICEIVRTCGYEPFFAQQRTDLRSLSEAIFDALSRSSAYIAVLHKREQLDSSGQYRTSLYIEQELALAAYIRRSRELPVLFYVQRGVELSGVRSTLLLNVSMPDKRDFEEDDEVVEHVRETLPALEISEVIMAGPNVKLEIRPEWAIEEGGLNVMRINILARNRGTTLPDRPIIARIWIPLELPLRTQQVGRAGLAGQDDELQLVQRTVTEIDPDPEQPTLIVTVVVPMIRGVAEKELKFRLVASGQRPCELRFTYGQLWKAAEANASLTS